MIYEVEWRIDDLIDTQGNGEKRTIGGVLRLEAQDFMDAATFAADEGLLDVDFLYPNQKATASSPRVKSGYLMWGNVQGQSIEEIWPELEEVWYENPATIIGIRESQAYADRDQPGNRFSSSPSRFSN